MDASLLTKGLSPKPKIPTTTGDNQLLLLGLQLLNKSLKLPYAVVKPQVQPPEKGGIGALKDGGEEFDKNDSCESTPSPPMTGNSRKRKHDGELTEMEKREKRKMMNRVAAQNARDRRKNYLESLEMKVAQLEKQNKELLEQNKELKSKTDTLVTEKRALELKLAQSSSLEATRDGVLSSVTEESGIECAGSAVPSISLQQKCTLVLLSQTWMILSLSCLLSCITNWQEPNSLPTQTLIRAFHHYRTNYQIATKNLFPLERQRPPITELWWGPHQLSWNPPMN